MLVAKRDNDFVGVKLALAHAENMNSSSLIYKIFIYL
jgi:hypothetical protein